MKKRASKVSAVFLLLLCVVCSSCRSILIQKNDPIVIDNCSGRAVVIDGGWRAESWSYGVFTRVGSLDIEITTNHTVRVKLNDYNGDMSTNHAAVAKAVGESVGESIKKALEGLK